LETLTEFFRQEKLPYTILHDKEIPASLLENAKKALTILNSKILNRFRGLICWQ
jgi:hypothetical protein